jgi:membrane fusion protein (multidrug efflux system)
MLVSSGSPVFSIVDPDSFVLTINPPEKQLQQLTIGQTAKITVDSITGEEFTAKVRRINPNVDQGQLKVTLDIEKAAREKLREGAFARVRLVMNTRKDALLVPKDAIVEENARKYLFLAKTPEGDSTVAQSVTNDTAPQVSAGTTPDPKATPPDTAAAPKPKMIAERIDVETGLEDKGQIEIVSGLKDGDQVIVRGQQTLKPKSPISVTTEEHELKAKATISADEALTAAESKRKAGAKAVPARQRRNL